MKKIHLLEFLTLLGLRVTHTEKMTQYTLQKKCYRGFPYCIPLKNKRYNCKNYHWIGSNGF
jgi:hypothetical protein